jgi:hypothetical protein
MSLSVLSVPPDCRRCCRRDQLPRRQRRPWLHAVPDRLVQSRRRRAVHAMPAWLLIPGGLGVPGRLLPSLRLEDTRDLSAPLPSCLICCLLCSCCFLSPPLYRFWSLPFTCLCARCGVLLPSVNRVMPLALMFPTRPFHSPNLRSPLLLPDHNKHGWHTFSLRSGSIVHCSRTACSQGSQAPYATAPNELAS